MGSNDARMTKVERYGRGEGSCMGDRFEIENSHFNVDVRKIPIKYINDYMELDREYGRRRSVTPTFTYSNVYLNMDLVKEILIVADDILPQHEWFEELSNNGLLYLSPKQYEFLCIKTTRLGKLYYENI